MGTEGWVSKPALFRPVKNWLSGFVHRRGVGPMVAGASNNARWNVYPPYTQERDNARWNVYAPCTSTTCT